MDLLFSTETKEPEVPQEPEMDESMEEPVPGNDVVVPEKLEDRILVTEEEVKHLGERVSTIEDSLESSDMPEPEPVPTSRSGNNLWEYM